MKHIELWSISLEASGPHSLAFNIAIWALHEFAALDRGIRTKYPPVAEVLSCQNSKTEQKIVTTAILLPYRWLGGIENYLNPGQVAAVLVVVGFCWRLGEGSLLRNVW